MFENKSDEEVAMAMASLLVNNKEYCTHGLVVNMRNYLDFKLGAEKADALILDKVLFAIENKKEALLIIEKIITEQSF